jgi:hypothetical protein
MLTAEQAQAIADSVVKRRFRRGELVVEQGRKSNALFILLNGRARVLTADTRGREVILAVLESGDYVGEMSLIDNEPHSATVRAEIRLVARPGAPALMVDLPLPGTSPKQARGAAQPDLSAHPWAGLPVRVALVAVDGATQEGRSEDATLTLPERAFTHPVAQALIALRRSLSLDPDARAAARAELDRITAEPEAFEDDTATFLTLRAARARLARDRRPEAVPASRSGVRVRLE